MTPGSENGTVKVPKRIVTWTGAILGVVAVATVAQGLLIHLLKPAIASAVAESVKAEFAQVRGEFRAADRAILREIRTGKSDLLEEVQDVSDELDGAATKAQLRDVRAKLDSLLSGKRRAGR